jgi:hypothetical protein
MRLRMFILTAVIALMAAIPPAQALTDEEKASGFCPSFNGKDLTGWTMVGDQTWSAKDGLLDTTGGPEGGWIRTDKVYKDFILRLEFKLAKDGNSGIFLRATAEGNPAYTGMEVQIMDDYGQPPSKTSTGSLFAAAAPRVSPTKPAGEWNDAEIICIGRRVKVTMNGQYLYSVNLDDPEMNASISEQFRFPNRAPAGFIGLQNHGLPAQFRNIRIKDWSTCDVKCCPFAASCGKG